MLKRLEVSLSKGRNAQVLGMFKLYYMHKLPASYIFILSMLFSSCEKVIDLPLNDAEPKLVIEGNIDDSNMQQTVKISWSTPFEAEEGQVFVSGASVEVTTSEGRVIEFNEARPGHYVARGFKGVNGRSYRLRVEYEGAQYEAFSTMPMRVPVDSIGFSESTFMERSFRTVNVLLQDPAERDNFYRFIVRPLKSNQQYAFIYNDKFTNGKKTVYNLSTVDMELAPRDSLLLEIMTVDRQMFNYWKGIQEQNPGNSNPGNPLSNLSNGALGYFSAHTLKTITLEVE